MWASLGGGVLGARLPPFPGIVKHSPTLLSTLVPCPTSSVSAGGAARCELAAALYQANVLGTKGPRKLTALLPKLEAGGRRPLRLAPKAELDTLLGQ